MFLKFPKKEKNLGHIRKMTAYYMRIFPGVTRQHAYMQAQKYGVHTADILRSYIYRWLDNNFVPDPVKKLKQTEFMV